MHIANPTKTLRKPEALAVVEHRAERAIFKLAIVQRLELEKPAKPLLRQMRVLRRKCVQKRLTRGKTL